MEIVKIDTGLINDDFIHDWVTMRVKLKSNQILLFKVEVDTFEIYSFHYNSETVETTLRPIDSNTRDYITTFIAKHGIAIL